MDRRYPGLLAPSIASYDSDRKWVEVMNNVAEREKERTLQDNCLDAKYCLTHAPASFLIVFLGLFVIGFVTILHNIYFGVEYIVTLIPDDAFYYLVLVII